MEREADTRYYSMGEGSWKRATSWPPPSQRIIRYYLDEGLRLAPHPPSASAGADEHIGEATSGTGLRSRWRTLVSPLVVPDYADLDRRGRIIYRSQPLTEPLSLAGHPLFTLYLKCSAADGGLFVYLEEETAEGRAYYVTEGLLRLIHRKSAIDPPAYVSPAPVRTYRRAQACPMGEPARSSARWSISCRWRTVFPADRRLCLWWPAATRTTSAPLRPPPSSSCGAATMLRCSSSP